MDDGVYLTDVGEEFIAQTLAFGCAFYKTGDIHKFDDGGGVFVRVVHFCQNVQTVVGNGDHAHVGLDGAEGIVCRLGAGVGDGVEEGAFANVGQTHDT